MTRRSWYKSSLGSDIHKPIKNDMLVLMTKSNITRQKNCSKQYWRNTHIKSGNKDT